VITEALEQGRNAKAIWQDLVDRHGFPQHYESVKRYVRKLRGSVVSLAHPTIVTAPGEEVSRTGRSGPPPARPSWSTWMRREESQNPRGAAAPAHLERARGTTWKNGGPGSAKLVHPRIAGTPASESRRGACEGSGPASSLLRRPSCSGCGRTGPRARRPRGAAIDPSPPTPSGRRGRACTTPRWPGSRVTKQSGSVRSEFPERLRSARRAVRKSLDPFTPTGTQGIGPGALQKLGGRVHPLALMCRAGSPNYFLT